MSEIQTNNDLPDIHTNKYNELVNFLKLPESEEIIKKNQPKLDDQNNKTTNYLEKNIKNTRDNINIDFNIGYTSFDRKREDVLMTPFKGFKGDLGNIKEYKDSQYIKNNNDYYYDIINRVDKALNRRERIYTDYEHRFISSTEYNKKFKEIDLAYTREIKFLSEVLSEESSILGHTLFSNNYKVRVKEDLKLIKDNFLIDNNNFSDTEINLMDAIKTQRTKSDIEEMEFIFTSFGIGLSEEEKKIISPLDILKDKYSNASEKDKLDLAILMSKYMGAFGYDHNFVGKSGDVSSEDIWASYKEGGVAGICRHHHSEVARFLKSVGFETGIVTTNSGGGHMITWGKKQDGTFFMIDYGSYYEGKDPKELKAKYLAGKGALDLKEWIGDENGKVIGNIQTDLEKLFESTTSSIGTGNSLNESKVLAKDGIDILKGHDIDINIDSRQSIDIEYKYGNGNIEGGVFFNKVNNLDYADYTSYGVSLAGKIGSRKSTLGELGAGIKLSENNFDWGEGKERKLRVGGMDLKYSNELYNNGNTKFGVGATFQSQIIQDVVNANKNGDNGIKDLTINGGISLDLKHKLGSNIEGNINFGYGGDIGFKNIRKEDKYKLFDKKSVDLGLNYKKDNGDRIRGNIFYETGLGYEKKGGNMELKSGNLGIELGYEEIDNSKNPFLLNEAKKSIGLQYNITDTFIINAGYENKDNGVNSDNIYNTSLNYKF